jgi:hypothetical protein
MNDSLRLLLRRIAIGAPIAVPAAGLALVPGLLACGSCPPSRHTLDYAQAPDRGGEVVVSCEVACERSHPGHGQLIACGWTGPHGTGEVECQYIEQVSCGVGRLPSSAITRRASAVASARLRSLLENATLELAAAPAFAELARALAIHGAPRSLVSRARRAVADEERHAAQALALVAREMGVARAHVRIAPAAPPTLDALAIHNAAEGCGREALGALEALHQSLHAPDADVRATMGSIAKDEARHALLSLDVDAWVRPRVSAITRTRMDEARAATLAALADAPAPCPSPGLPDASARAAMIALVA